MINLHLQSSERVERLHYFSQLTILTIASPPISARRISLNTSTEGFQRVITDLQPDRPGVHVHSKLANPR